MGDDVVDKRWDKAWLADRREVVGGLAVDYEIDSSPGRVAALLWRPWVRGGVRGVQGEESSR